MSNEWLLLELKNQCGNGECKCTKQPSGITATKETNKPIKGYTKCIHKLKTTGSFTLRDVKYYTITNKPSGPIYNLNAIAVYYDTDNRPFVIEVTRAGGVKECYYNNNPSNAIYDSNIDTQDNDDSYYANSSWTQDSNLSDSQRLKEKLEELSCQYFSSIPLDIYKGKTSSSYCVSTKVGIKGGIFENNRDFYEFKQYAINNSFKVPYLRYDNKELNIPVNDQEIQEVSSIFWKHNFANPLVVKTVSKGGKIQYYFSTEGEQWTKKNDKDVKKLETAVIEHNCTRNRTIVIDLSKKDNTYCCTDGCKKQRIQVTPEKSLYSGFIAYEHSSKDKHSFTIGNIVKDGEKQKGIKYPIRDAYRVTVYYAITCPKEPIFVDIKYAYDEEFLDNKWYKRITQNGWDDKLNVPDTDDEVNKALRENFKTVVRVLTSDCDFNKLPDDNPKFIRVEPEPRMFSSPENLIKDLQQLKKDGFTPPVGPETEESSKKLIGRPSAQRKALSQLKHKDTKITTDTKILFDLVTQIVEESIQVNGNNLPQLEFLRAASPGIIIDIREKPNNGDEPYTYGSTTTYTYGGSADQKVKVTRGPSDDPPGSGFVKFTHQSPDGDPFKVEKVLFGQNKHSKDCKEELGIKNGEEIQHLAVWYWKGDSNMTNPLLIEVKVTDEDFRYISNKGGLQWQPVSGYETPRLKQLTGDDLETQLDDLNCQLNKASTINISKSNSESHSNKNSNQNRYCCSTDHNGEKRVSVTSDKVSCTQEGHSPTHIPYFKHNLIYAGVKLAKIKYYLDCGKRTRITSTELDFPIDAPITISVFYCEGNSPVLICVNSTGKDRDLVAGWYKKNITHDNQPWVKVTDDLSSKSPEDIKKCDDKEFDALVKVLRETGGCNYGECTYAITQPALVSVEKTLGVTIQLKQKPKGKINTTNYSDTTGGKKITVTRTFYPEKEPHTHDFYKFTHISTASFKLKEVEDNDGKKIKVIKGSEGTTVGLIAAHYWKHGTSKNPLLIKVQYGSKYSYYTNSRNNVWVKYEDLGQQLSPEQLLQKLILLNCDINDVVQIDVTKTSNYCHEDGDIMDNHADKKVSVKEVPGSSDRLGNYTAYQHTPNPKAYYGINLSTFNISAFTNKGKPIPLKALQHILPVMNTNRVVVYMCEKKPHDKTPLLIYVPESSGDKWFQTNNEGDSWDTVGFGAPENDDDYNKIFRILDKLQSDCKPPEVTINIYNGSVIGQSTVYVSDSSNVYVTPNYTTSIDGFTESIYKVHGRNYFIVKEFKCDDIQIRSFETPIKYVTSVLVYYWSPLETKQGNQRGRPLLVNVVTKAPGIPEKVTFYENIGAGAHDNANWKFDGTLPPTRAATRSKLHLLNCKLNNAVIIDVSKNKDKETYDACNNTDKLTLDTGHGNDRMQVQKDDESGKFLGSYSVYKHTLSKASEKFHIVGFKNGTNPINIGGIPSSPILDVEEVKVYMCNGRPLLIYIYSKDPRVGGKKLYQNENLSSLSGQWTDVTLDSTASDDPEEHENILEVLKTLDSSCSIAEEGKTEKSVAVGIATVGLGYGIYGIVSGPLAGAGGLTGLG